MTGAEGHPSSCAWLSCVAGAAIAYARQKVITGRRRIRRVKSCNGVKLRCKRDFSMRISTLKLPFGFRVQYNVKAGK